MPRIIRPHRLPHFLSSQSDYFTVVLLSGIVGTLAGGVVSYFNIFINWIIEFRLDYVLQATDDDFLLKTTVAVLAGAAMAGLGFWLTIHYAPEAEGSGIPHIEGALLGEHDIRWYRVLPVKFISAILAIGSGMILGRGGPSIQLGGAVGRMVASRSENDRLTKHILIAAGSAAGMAAAFNTPLAAILFVNEEMRRQFSYNSTSIKSVTLAVACATIVMELLNGQNAILKIPSYSAPPLYTLISFVILGLVIGVIGVYFNRWILSGTAWFKNHHGDSKLRFVLTGVLLGGLFSLIHLYFPFLSGGSLTVISDLFYSPSTWIVMAGLSILRMFGTISCFSSGAPGGIFAPLLTLGTFLGLTFGGLIAALSPDTISDPNIYAVAGMGALIAATLRTPLTSVVLVVEISNNYHLILPILVTSLGASFIAHAMGGKPLYASLIELKQKDWKY
ncbi:H(+)/Cl(-) exchange transporter ClcA [Vibrio sp. HA2012]|uniref:H(+)/Cl(-) exchange transporter ClcA n=1 Tax=Vibrio sp. HA2012 TaxID=1971595 RepID=UPI000C2C2F2E|nr:H(+)/Cl(-) exchange transporter ClcA [Vibrio sp. HA2012]PJC87375.1 H(+)/Cl(-) exchange transporter ClcA [Vibrio sp. HA2012]